MISISEFSSSPCGFRWPNCTVISLQLCFITIIRHRVQSGAVIFTVFQCCLGCECPNEVRMILHFRASLEMHFEVRKCFLHGELLRPKLEPKSTLTIHDCCIENHWNWTSFGHDNLASDTVSRYVKSRGIHWLRLLRYCLSGAYKAWNGSETKRGGPMESSQCQIMSINEMARKLQNACWHQVWF